MFNMNGVQKMEYRVSPDGAGATFVRSNGHHITFSPAEIAFLFHEMTRRCWMDSIGNVIDLSRDCIDFSEISEEEFTQWCIDELDAKWELGTIDCDPDFESIVFDVAQDNGMWVNE